MGALVLEMHHRRTSYWAWPREAWVEILCPTARDFKARYKWTTTHARQALVTSAYLLGLFSGELAKRSGMPSRVRAAAKELDAMIASWGASEDELMAEYKQSENLASYLEAGTPLAITRHGETLGFYIPAQKRNRKAELEAMRAAAKDLNAMIASWGATEDELMAEYRRIRRAAREKKGNAK